MLHQLVHIPVILFIFMLHYIALNTSFNVAGMFDQSKLVSQQLSRRLLNSLTFPNCSSAMCYRESCSVYSYSMKEEG